MGTLSFDGIAAFLMYGWLKLSDLFNASVMAGGGFLDSRAVLILESILPSLIIGLPVLALISVTFAYRQAEKKALYSLVMLTALCFLGYAVGFIWHNYS